jgi:AraC family transcriptional regulator, transcriptional activator of pobA
MSINEGTGISEYHLNQHQPKKLQFAVHNLQQYLEAHTAKASKPHIHSYYQIIWFKSGTGKHFVDFKEYDIVENAIFFIAKNQVHYFDQHINYEGVLVHFNEQFLVQNDTEVDFLVKCSLFNNPYQQPSCCIGKAVVQVLDEYIQQIKTELQNEEDFGKEELLRTYLKAFLIQVQRRKNEFEMSEGKFPFTVDEKRAQMIRFVNLVDEHYNKGLTVSEYAGKMNMSARTLSDLVRHVINKSPSGMIQERIVVEAQRLLLHSNLNVNQIGYRLGFDDPSYFVKFFKKHTGISPSEFRKSIC